MGIAIVSLVVSSRSNSSARRDTTDIVLMLIKRLSSSVHEFSPEFVVVVSAAAMIDARGPLFSSLISLQACGSCVVEEGVHRRHDELLPWSELRVCQYGLYSTASARHTLIHRAKHLAAAWRVAGECVSAT